MEVVLSRQLQERRIFPAIDILKSGTRRDDLLLSSKEQEAMTIIRRGFNDLRAEQAADSLLYMFEKTKNNDELVEMIIKKKKF